MPSTTTTTTSAPNITTTKTAFLQSQTRLLSSPLHPSLNWQQSSSSASTTNDTSSPPFPEKTLTDLLTKLNTKIRSHNRLVFSLPSQRHVAEQIDALYWNDVLAHHTPSTISSTNGHTEEIWIDIDADLTHTETVRGLPDTLPPPASNDPQAQVDRYTALKQDIQSLVSQRDKLRKQVESYRALKTLLAPLEDARGHVQPNLVTRDGELSVELERMRVLVARVGAGLDRDGGDGVGRDNEREEEGEQEVVGDREKLDRVLMELG